VKTKPHSETHARRGVGRAQKEWGQGAPMCVSITKEDQTGAGNQQSNKEKEKGKNQSRRREERGKKNNGLVLEEKLQKKKMR